MPGSPSQPEVIIADGGSCDATALIAQKCAGVQVLRVDQGRGAQLNAAADAASGHWLLFLHADCTLPQDYFEALSSATQPRHLSRWQRLRREQATPRWGCFAALQTGCASMAAVQWGVKLRTSVLGTPYGDQGLFCHRSAFHQVRACIHAARARAQSCSQRWRDTMGIASGKSVHICALSDRQHFHFCMCVGAQVRGMAISGRPGVGAIDEVLLWQARDRAFANAHVGAAVALLWCCTHDDDQSMCAGRLCSGCACGCSAPILHASKAQVRKLNVVIQRRCCQVLRWPDPFKNMHCPS